MSAAWMVSMTVDLAYRPRMERKFSFADHVDAMATWKRLQELSQMLGWDNYHTDELPGLRVAHLRIVHPPRKGQPAPLVERATVSLARVGGIEVAPRRAGKTRRRELIQGMEPSVAIWDETMKGKA